MGHKAANFEPLSGLSVILYIHQHEYIQNDGESAGTVVVAHES